MADPARAPASEACIHQRPDDRADNGTSWRDILRNYNTSGDNPHGLLPAWRLYRHPVYERLWNRFGPERLYILSAGWGLIRADFLVPFYDITFSRQAEIWKRRPRSPSSDWSDFRMLPREAAGSVVFFGGKDYVGLFCRLTDDVRGGRHIWFNSKNEPDAPDCALRRFHTKAKIGWHYICASAFLNGDIGVEQPL